MTAPGLGFTMLPRRHEGSRFLYKQLTSCSCGVQAALQRALAGSYAAISEFQERTGGQLLPVTKAGDVIY